MSLHGHSLCLKWEKQADVEYWAVTFCCFLFHKEQSSCCTSAFMRKDNKAWRWSLLDKLWELCVETRPHIKVSSLSWWENKPRQKRFSQTWPAQLQSVLCHLASFNLHLFNNVTHGRPWLVCRHSRTARWEVVRPENSVTQTKTKTVCLQSCWNQQDLNACHCGAD